MSIRQLKEADYLLSQCGRPVPPAGARYVDLPHCLTFRQQITPSVGSSLAMSFPFFPDTVAFQQDYFEQGVTGESAPPTAPEIRRSLASSNTGSQVDQPGPWSDGGNRRFMILPSAVRHVHRYAQGPSRLQERRCRDHMGGS